MTVFVPHKTFGLGFRLSGSRSRGSGLAFRVPGLGLRFQVSVSSFCFRVSGNESHLVCFGFWG